MPGKMENGHLVATISLEITEPVKAEDESFVATHGDIIRVAGTFTCGQSTKIIAKKLEDGKQLWIEITFDAGPQVKPEASSKLPPAIYQEVPSAQSRQKTRR